MKIAILGSRGMHIGYIGLGAVIPYTIAVSVPLKNLSSTFDKRKKSSRPTQVKP